MYIKICKNISIIKKKKKNGGKGGGGEGDIGRVAPATACNPCARLVLVRTPLRMFVPPTLICTPRARLVPCCCRCRCR
jgi:hypothetical protein